MDQIKKINKIFKDFKIKNYKKETMKFIEIYNQYDLININNIISNDIEMHGGGENDSTIIKFQGKKFEFEKQKNEYNIIYSLKTKKSNPSCIIIFINKKEHFATIHEIYYDESCLYLDMADEHKTGGTILKLALLLIDKVKDHYKLKYVRLMDNSTKKCPIITKSIILSKMMILMTGDTWYGKYGFRPFSDGDKKETEFLYKKYLLNKEIMENARIKDIAEFKDIITIALKETKLHKSLEKYVIELFDECYKNNSLITYFISELLTKEMFYGDKKTAGICAFFAKFDFLLFDLLGLYNFHKYSFIKIL